MNTVRRITVGVGFASCLFVLIFPPLRSPTNYYAETQSVDQQLVAVHISRFSSWHHPTWARVGPDVAISKYGVIVRTEIDAGELLRELVFIMVLFGGAYLWLPATLDRARSHLARTS